MKRILNNLFNLFTAPRDAIGTRRLWIIFAGVVLTGYVVAGLISPGYTIRKLTPHSEPGTLSAGTAKAGIPEYPEISGFIRQKGYLESCLKMAAKDSIGLTIDLRDSIVSLEISGIPVHTCKINTLHTDRFFYALNNSTTAALFSRPLVVEKHHGSIVKEHVFVRKAPRDTIEAARNVFTPDTVYRTPAFVTMEFNHGIRLILEERGRKTAKWSIRFLLHHAGNRISHAGKSIFSILSFKVPVYEPEIRIGLPGKEVRTIYRALPEKANVTILF